MLGLLKIDQRKRPEEGGASDPLVVGAGSFPTPHTPHPAPAPTGLGEEPGSTEGEFIDWLTIDDQAKSVYADVKRIRFHPLVPREISIYGYIYDVQTGKLIEVTEATHIGKAS
ncbi:hypothetical protein [Tolypothrix sp. VBCCA 56010]|uniref:hypothetical protein n=1 Tax=Tolypothrix sp. VBCCA 56010 TaxID=3137731 RepID=UPI003D7C84B7